MMFGAEKIIREIQIDMTELIADYLNTHPHIEARVNHNFQMILQYINEKFKKV